MTNPRGTRGSGFTGVFTIIARMAVCSTAREGEKGGHNREDKGVACVGGGEGLGLMPFKDPTSGLSGDFSR
jgi:hypothetical protein